MQIEEIGIIGTRSHARHPTVLRHGRAVDQETAATQVQEIDIIGAMLAAVRESLGAVFTPEAEKEIETKLRTCWGGERVYVKKQTDAHARASEIRARYDMCNRRELMAEYGLSRGHFYKIIAGG